jgi:hypothetical protein
MKRILLVISHLGAGSASLCYYLAQNKIIQWMQDGIIYDHPTESIESLLSTKHKYSNSTGLYVNEVLYNYQISHKTIYQACEFIYLIRDPKSSIKILKPTDAHFALNYYIFRLRRIYEMARETKGAVFLTWDDLMNQKGIKMLINKLNLQSDMPFEEFKSDKVLFDLPKPLLAEAERAYELCLYRVKNSGQVVRC